MSPLRTAVPRYLLFATFLLLLLFIASQPQHSRAGGDPTVFFPVVINSDIADQFPRGSNLLQNSSFEGGWYQHGGVPELQIPNDWVFTWKEGPTGFGNESWDVWVRPEVNVKLSNQLPSHERPLFIWDGDQTLKIFKGWGAINYTLTQDVRLTPGTYVFEFSVFPDLIVGYNSDGSKIWAPDPLSGEVKLLAGPASTDWLLPTFGQKNTYYLVFKISQTQTVQMGTKIRGRWAIRNKGWFMDDWWLWRATGPTLPPGVYRRHIPPLFAADYTSPAEPFSFPVGSEE
jgi:hypothetical protein